MSVNAYFVSLFLVFIGTLRKSVGVCRSGSVVRVASVHAVSL